MGGRKKQSLINGALILVVATAVVEVVGVLYKIPLTELIGTVGRGYTGTAYGIYIPIYNISMAGLPVAISKLVAESIANGHFNNVKKIFKVAFRLFFAMGVIGTGVLCLLAYPYAKSMESLASLPSIFMIAPAVFICCVMATYRGYYSGLRNQTPSAVSQIFEVIGKLVFGLGLAAIIQRYGITCFENGKAVFGTECATLDEAIIALTPYAAAASIFGVTMGAVCSLLFLMIRHKVVGDKITKEELSLSPAADTSKNIAKLLLTIAVPVVVSTLVMNITNFIDAWSIQTRLLYAVETGRPIISSMFEEGMINTAMMDAKLLRSYLYGAYEIAIDFRNLVPTITTTLGMSAIPVLAEAWTLKNKLMIRSSIESVMRITMLISLPAGIGMAILSKDLLTIMYGNKDSLSISALVMTLYACFTFIMAAAQPLINMLQAIGRADIPMKAVCIAAIVKVAVNFVLVGIPQFNILGAIIGTFCFYLITVSIDINALIRETGVKLNYKSVFFKPLLCSAMCGLGAWAVTGLCKHFLPQFAVGEKLTTATVSALIGIIAAVIIYVFALLFTKTVVKEDIKMLPKGEKICKVLEKYDLIG